MGCRGKKPAPLILQQAEHLRISLSNVRTSSRSKSFFNAGNELTFWGGGGKKHKEGHTTNSTRAEQEGKTSTWLQQAPQLHASPDPGGEKEASDDTC